MSANDCRHLLRALQVELVGVEGHLRLRERRLRLHAQQRRVVVVVLAAQVVDVGGRDERPAHLARELRDRLVDLLLLGDPVALDLEVDVLGAERLDEVVEVRARVLRAGPRRSGGWRARRGSPRARSRRRRGARAAPCRRPACRGAGPRGSRRWRASSGCGSPRRLRASSVRWLRSILPSRIVRSSTKYASRPRIGLTSCFRQALKSSTAPFITPWSVRPERRLAELGRAGGELVDLAGAVEQRVLRVDVEMGAGGRAHGRREG